jgi:hypothetical protein
LEKSSQFEYGGSKGKTEKKRRMYRRGNKNNTKNQERKEFAGWVNPSHLIFFSEYFFEFLGGH